MKKTLLYTGMLIGFIVLTSYTIQKEIKTNSIEKDTPVADVLAMLGDNAPNHTVNGNITDAKIKKGENLVLYGSTSIKKSKKLGKRQSKYFVCTSCHNVKKEDADLRLVDPQKRLEYAKANNLPFLQGSPLYGIVNRTTFYNGDYEKKYGDLVKKARNDMREAIQLCAIECSQGRALKKSEMEAVLAYLWSIGLKMDDLNLSEADWNKIKTDAEDESKKEALIPFIKSFYLQASPATFADAPKDRAKGYDYEVNPDNGKLIYDLGCKHCHENSRYSFYSLDDSKLTFRDLEKSIAKYNENSIYHLVRYGTKPLNGQRAYMPNYTLEKMSHQQVEDLRAYIEKMAK